MVNSDGQIDKPQRGRPKRAELPDVNIYTGAQSINFESASLKWWMLSVRLSRAVSERASQRKTEQQTAKPPARQEARQASGLNKRITISKHETLY